MKNLKSYLSISEIGKFRFYSGIIIGIGFGFIFNSLFRMTFKLCNLGIYLNQWSLSNELSTYNTFLIGFAASGFSFCFTTYLWTSRPFTSNRRSTLRLRMAQSNSIWILFGVLLFLLRMFWLFASVELTIEKDFPLLGFLIPTFIYLYCWNLISAVYRSLRFFITTSVVVVIIAVILSSI